MAEKITFDSIPEALENMRAEITDIHRMLSGNQPQQKPQNRLMIIDEAAEFLKLSKPTLYRLVSAREIPFHKQSGKLYFLETELLDWVKAGRKLGGR